MLHNAYSIRDTVSEIFAAPFFVPSDGVAKRFLSELVVNPNSDIGKYPKDFMLYRVGTYDTETAKLTPLPVELVCSASSLLPKRMDFASEGPLPSQEKAALVEAFGAAVKESMKEPGGSN